MAITVNNTGITGNNPTIRTGSFDCDNSYPTGGWAVDLTTLGLRETQHMVIEDKGGYSFQFDRANRKIIARWFNYPAGAAAVAVEVTNGTDLSAVTDVGFVSFGAA